MEDERYSSRLCMSTPTPIMSPEDELALPPWTKWHLFRVPPYKLILHVLLLVTLTLQALSVNTLFAPYSRAMMASVVNLYFPPGFTAMQSPITSAQQYYIFTQQQAVDDSNLLFSAYFSMPYTSVNQVLVYQNSSATNGLQPPSVAITSTSGQAQTYSVPSLEAVNTSWPLGLAGGLATDPDSLRTFFRGLANMRFTFPIVSYGNNDDIKRQSDVCYRWTLMMLYDLSSR